ncbi:MAG: response regulator, partial [Cytophagales bacterium]|nr:response regulator [Cytophagales bacterium]
MLPTISTVIIEDEPSAVKRLTKELKRLGDIQFDIVTSIDSVAGAIDWFNGSNKVDLVFMDIQLSDGLSFEIFKNTSISSPVIFTTAYDEYALQAFKVNSLDYLLKPINPPDLRNAIDRFLALHDNFSREAYMDQLVRLANEFRPQTYRSSF